MTADTDRTRQGRDPGAVRDFMRVVAPVMRTYFRCTVRGMAHIPDGGALVVSNHSGGALTLDHAVFLTGFTDHFGFEREFYLLAHEALFQAPVERLLRSWGVVPASRELARDVLRKGGITLVFPGGEYDAARPFHQANRIDFAGRNGYVRTALEAGVPLVPCVSIGGQETQLFLSRGQRLIEGLGLRRLGRARSIPISFGFPFGLSAIVPVNLPLPSKITTSVLPAVDLSDVGENPDVDAIDAEVRRRMQAELDVLAAERRYPVVG